MIVFLATSVLLFAVLPFLVGQRAAGRVSAPRVAIGWCLLAITMIAWALSGGGYLLPYFLIALPTSAVCLFAALFWQTYARLPEELQPGLTLAPEE